MSASKDQIIQKIVSKGYWKVQIRPNEYKEKRIEVKEIENIAIPSVISLRGWDFPHYRDRNGGPYITKDGIEKITDIGQYVEYWTMTSSANFIYLGALKEDLIDNTNIVDNIMREYGQKYDRWLEVINTLYRITEIYEYAKRLALKLNIGGQIVIEIELSDIENRILWFTSFDRISFSVPMISREKKWTYKDIVNESDLIGRSDEYAFKAFEKLMLLFQWKSIPIDSYRNDQQKLLQGKL